VAAYATLDDLDVADQRVLVRVDLNVPMQDGEITDFTRIDRAAETIQELSERSAKVVMLSHFGRPKGKVVAEMSLAPVAKAFAERTGLAVDFAADCVGATAEAAQDAMTPGSVLLLENLRFHAGEEANDGAFARALAATGALYVNDAFSCAHRAHASTEAIAHLLPAAAGRLMQAELEALDAVLGAPERPVAAIVGGAKVSTKLDVLGNLAVKVDAIVIGGAMANTFLMAQGIAIGKSLAEPDLIETARDILADAGRGTCEILLPSDVVIARSLAVGVDTRTVAVDAVPDDWMILDVGPESTAALINRLGSWRTLLWNGPLGAFEFPPFDAATVALAKAAADATDRGRVKSVAGGGDTVAALNQAGAADRFSYVSTAGGAFLEWLEGKELPGVAALSHD